MLACNSARGCGEGRHCFDFISNSTVGNVCADGSLSVHAAAPEPDKVVTVARACNTTLGCSAGMRCTNNMHVVDAACAHVSPCVCAWASEVEVTAVVACSTGLDCGACVRCCDILCNRTVSSVCTAGPRCVHAPAPPPETVWTTVLAGNTARLRCW